MTEIHEDMLWWRNYANKDQVLLSPCLLTCNVTTDTSNTGWGGISDEVVTGVLWSKDEQ